MNKFLKALSDHHKDREINKCYLMHQYAVKDSWKHNYLYRIGAFFVLFQPMQQSIPRNVIAHKYTLGCFYWGSYYSISPNLVTVHNLGRNVLVFSDDYRTCVPLTEDLLPILTIFMV